MISLWGVQRRSMPQRTSWPGVSENRKNSCIIQWSPENSQLCPTIKGTECDFCHWGTLDLKASIAGSFEIMLPLNNHHTNENLSDVTQTKISTDGEMFPHSLTSIFSHKWFWQEFRMLKQTAVYFQMTLHLWQKQTNEMDHYFGQDITIETVVKIGDGVKAQLNKIYSITNLMLCTSLQIQAWCFLLVLVKVSIRQCDAQIQNQEHYIWCVLTLTVITE